MAVPGLSVLSSPGCSRHQAVRRYPDTFHPESGRNCLHGTKKYGFASAQATGTAVHAARLLSQVSPISIYHGMYGTSAGLTYTYSPSQVLGIIVHGKQVEAGRRST